MLAAAIRAFITEFTKPSDKFFKRYDLGGH
jgi:hypothetical protein